MPWPVLLTTAALLAAALGVEIAKGAPNISALIWRPAIRRFRRIDAASDWPGGAVLLYGSSTFAWWDGAAAELAPWPVVNRGFGGARTVDLLRYAGDVLAGGTPRAVVLFVANDVTGSLWDVSPRRAAEQFEALLHRIRGRYGEVPVVWLEVNPTPRRWGVWPHIRDLNAAFREVCGRFGGVHADAAWGGLMIGGEPDPRYFRADRLHLNADGYRVFAAGLRDALRRHVGQPAG